MKFLDYDGLLYFWQQVKGKLNNKVDKEDGKQLSTNDYTTEEKNKLAGISSGAQANVIETVQLNGSSITPADKTVNVQVSKSTVGLNNVTNDAQVKRSEMGKANGVATLDNAGKVPAAQLPSYVDDVIEGYYSGGKFYTSKDSSGNYSGVITGETGKIYVNLNDSKTYRWSGTAYVVISETLALGETSSTAYAGNKGAANASEIAKIKDGTTVVPKATSAADVNGFTVAANVPAGAKFTDTTYSDMKGATGSAAGTHGLVPAPAAGANTKFLRGDGTWQNTPNTDTHYSAKNVISNSSSGQSNASNASNPFLNLIENGAVRSSHQIKGGGATTVTTDASGNLVISSVNSSYDLSGYLKKTDLTAIANSEIDTIIAS